MHNEGKYLSDDITCMIHVIIKQTLKKYSDNLLPLDIFKSEVGSLKTHNLHALYSFNDVTT